MKNWILPGLAIIAIIALLIIGPIPQNQEYHNFADTRSFFGIPNFWDVTTNLLFLVVGIWSWFYVSKNISVSTFKAIAATLSLGFILLCFGSGYYHLSPNDFTLVFDRIPMAVIFMSFFSIFIHDYIDEKKASTAFYILIPLGILSVIYWYFTEVAGNGDLRLYILVQFFPIIAIPLILVLYQSAFKYVKEVIFIFLFFALAKMAEALDEEIFNFLKILSGHSLKHLLMAVSGIFIIHLLKVRKKCLSVKC